jgi:uncharacterized protein
MQLTRHPTDEQVGISGYRPGQISAGGKRFASPLRIAWATPPRDIELPEIEQLDWETLSALLLPSTEIILLGCGQHQTFPPTATLAEVQTQGIGCEAMTSDAACRTYNVLISEQRRVLALIHP